MTATDYEPDVDEASYDELDEDDPDQAVQDILGGMTLTVELAREKAELDDLVKATEDELKKLKARKKKLGHQLADDFANVGISSLRLDNGRTAYIYPNVVPEFQERSDGSKYAWEDLVPVLEMLDRRAQIAAPTVHHATLMAIIKEYAAAGKPLPAALTAIVQPRKLMEVRIGRGSHRRQ